MQLAFTHRKPGLSDKRICLPMDRDSSSKDASRSLALRRYGL